MGVDIYYFYHRFGRHIRMYNNTQLYNCEKINMKSYGAQDRNIN
jgi:hypothetical protein